MTLEDYKDLVASVASITTIAQFFAPVFMCIDFIKKGTTKDVDPTPFVGNLVMSILMLEYGLILNDPAMLQVNKFGLGLGIVYLTLFYFYTTSRSGLHGMVGKALALVSVLVGYSRFEHKDKVEFRFGVIVTGLMLTLIASPLLQLGQIIRNRSTAGLPFPLILSGTIVTASWLLYGIIINNFFMQLQNVVAFTLCVIQLSLFVIFPKRSTDVNQPDTKSESKKSL